MRIQGLLPLLFIVPFCSCTWDHGSDRNSVTEPPEERAGMEAALDPAVRDVLGFDIVQRTCALYVAIRSGALEGSAFGRDVDDGMARWNMCPGGTMIACAITPTANGDTVITGIPWPYGPAAVH